MTTINDYVSAIEHALSAELETHKEPSELYAPIHYLFQGGGKRIRPLLVLLSAEVVGGNIDTAMPAALAAELLHNFTLVHDDIMDRSALRRGRATIHTKYSTNDAILSGDVLLGLAMRLMAKSVVNNEKASHVYQAFAQGFIDVCEGQSLDMSLASSASTSLDEYFHMIERKTARLLEMCVVIGATIGNGTAMQVQALRTFARDLGVAFQLQDDILDLEGSDEFGKTPGGDLVQGKRTWLMLRARDLTRNDHAAYQPLIAEFFTNNGIPHSKVAEMRTALDVLGVSNEARAIVQHLTNEAFGHLNLLPDTPARDLLRQLANQLMLRSI